jgi:hypothetical protein
MKDMVKLQEAKIETTNVNAEIEKQFGFTEQSTECAMNDIMIRNNISAIKEENIEICNDNYDIGF